MKYFALIFIILICTTIQSYAQSLIVPTDIDWGNVPVGMDYTSPANYYYYFSITNNSNNIIDLVDFYTESSSQDNIFFIDNINPAVISLMPQQTYYPTITYTSQDTGITYGGIEILYKIKNDTIVETIIIPMVAHSFNYDTIFLTTAIGGTQYLCQTAPIGKQDEGHGNWYQGEIELFNPIDDTLYIDSIQQSGDTNDFSNGGIIPFNGNNYITLPFNVLPNNEIDFYYLFYPQDTGWRAMNITLFFHTNKINAQTLKTTIYGHGDYQQILSTTDELILNPIYLDNNYTHEVSLENCGDSVNIIAKFIGPDTANLSFSNQQNIFYINKGGELLLNVEFTPKIAGKSIDTILFIANYVNGIIDTEITKIIIDALPSSIPELFRQETNIINNYPNPFHILTTIQLNTLAQQAEQISIMDMLGREVSVFKRTPEEYTPNEFEWTPGAGMPSGKYFLRVVTRDGVKMTPMVYLR